MLKKQSSKNFKKLALSNVKGLTGFGKTNGPPLRSPASPVITRNFIKNSQEASLSSSHEAPKTFQIKSLPFKELLLPEKSNLVVSDTTYESLPAGKYTKDYLSNLKKVLSLDKTANKVRRSTLNPQNYNFVSSFSKKQKGDLLESYIASLFNSTGIFKTKKTGGSFDFGIDIYAQALGYYFQIQCKNNAPPDPRKLKSCIDKANIYKLSTSNQIGQSKLVEKGIAPDRLISIIVGNTPWVATGINARRFDDLGYPAIFIGRDVTEQGFIDFIKVGEVAKENTTDWYIHFNDAANKLLPKHLQEDKVQVFSFGIDISEFKGEIDEVVCHANKLVEEKFSELFCQNDLMTDVKNLKDHFIINDGKTLEVPIYISRDTTMEQRERATKTCEAFVRKSKMAKVRGVELREPFNMKALGTGKSKLSNLKFLD